MRATGDEKEFSQWEQDNLLAKGHETEAAARAFVEEMLGEELYPVTASDDAGRLLASFDGITMDGETGFEHKLWNEDLAAAVQRGEVPPEHQWQLEQQILVGGLRRVIFVCSNGTREKMVHAEYTPVHGRAAELLAGWKQLEEDVATYQHVEVIPAPRGKVIRDLPVISVQLTGKVRSSNLAEYRAGAMKFIAAIDTDLKTDQDFADADKTIKFCEDAEAKLEAAKKAALTETASIADLFTTLDELRVAMRGKRLELNALVEARKKAIRAEILSEGQVAFTAHIAGLNQRIGKNYMPIIQTDFPGAMKGKKTIESLRNAVDTELARAKIAANTIADRIGVNLNAMRELAIEHQFLFADLAQIVLKETDDFAALVKMRIADHKAKETARLEAERERIRKEEEAKAQTATAAAPAPAPAPRPLTGNVTPLRKPTDDQIIELVARQYNVAELKAIDWLAGMDLSAARGARNSEVQVTT
jgi:predicted phage-related endonuclease